MGNPDIAGANSDPSLVRRIFGGNFLPNRRAQRIGNFSISAAQRSYEAEQEQKVAQLAARLALRNNQTH